MPAAGDDGLEPEVSHGPLAPGGIPRRRLLLIAAASALVAGALGAWWFAPQTLLFDDVVDEGFPVVEAVGPDEGVPATSDDGGAAGVGLAPSDPVGLASGSFVSRNRYTVIGTATIYELGDGQRLLRLEDFESTNGPDLFVHLTVAGASDDDAALDADFVDLGVLSGNIGNQNYVIPADVDLDRYTAVVIWCRRFTTSFGVADLTP